MADIGDGLGLVTDLGPQPLDLQQSATAVLVPNPRSEDPISSHSIARVARWGDAESSEERTHRKSRRCGKCKGRRIKCDGGKKAACENCIKPSIHCNFMPAPHAGGSAALVLSSLGVRCVVKCA